MWKEYEHLLGFGPSTRQPLFALEFIPTKNHARIRAIPVDGGHLSIVFVTEQFVCFESLVIESRGRPAGPTTTAFTIFAPLFEILSSIEGRSL